MNDKPDDATPIAREDVVRTAGNLIVAYIEGVRKTAEAELGLKLSYVFAMSEDGVDGVMVATTLGPDDVLKFAEALTRLVKESAVRFPGMGLN